MIGLGCMRLSTQQTRDRARSIAVIHAALDAGATLLDSADAYGHDEGDVGHNERLIAEALHAWSGDRTAITVATKGGLRRPGGRWVPDGRARHLRSACAASRQALGTDVLDLYQLHAVDPRTRLETSVRALAALRDAGHVRKIGLCNVTVAQIEAAQRITPIDTVQVALSVLDDTNLRNGVAEYCRDRGIPLIAYRPLGGERSDRLTRDPVLAALAEERGVTAHEIALAWLLDLDDTIVPIPGATRPASARSLARVLQIRFRTDERERLDARFTAATQLRERRSARRPPARSEGEVVLVMGMPAAGKSSAAAEFVERGYRRLNRDARGGRLTDLVGALDAGLAAGDRRFVLDNTYPSRKSRNEIIECAWRHGVPVRCVWIETSLPDAQHNAVVRMIEAAGRLPDPAEIAARGRDDPRFFGPDAQFRYRRVLEPPREDEGFSAMERRPFVRAHPDTHTKRALVFEFDGVVGFGPGDDPAAHADELRILPERREALATARGEGWRLFATAWRPGADADAVSALFERARNRLGVEIDFAHCPHPPGPPVCWCRKPLPGLVLAFAHRHEIALDASIVIGRSAADRTLATRLGMAYRDHADWFDDAG